MYCWHYVHPICPGRRQWHGTSVCCFMCAFFFFQTKSISIPGSRYCLSIIKQSDKWKNSINIACIFRVHLFFTSFMTSVWLENYMRQQNTHNCVIRMKSIRQLSHVCAPHFLVSNNSFRYRRLITYVPKSVKWRIWYHDFDHHTKMWQINSFVTGMLMAWFIWFFCLYQVILFDISPKWFHEICK